MILPKDNRHEMRDNRHVGEEESRNALKKLKQVFEKYSVYSSCLQKKTLLDIRNAMKAI